MHWTQHKAAAPQKPGLHLPVGAGGSPGVVGVNRGSLWGKDTGSEGPENPDQRELSWG